MVDHGGMFTNPVGSIHSAGSINPVGSWKRRFHSLHGELVDGSSGWLLVVLVDGSLERVPQFIIAAAVLHNICRLRGVSDENDEEMNDDQPERRLASLSLAVDTMIKKRDGDCGRSAFLIQIPIFCGFILLFSNSAAAAVIPLDSKTWKLCWLKTMLSSSISMPIGPAVFASVDCDRQPDIAQKYHVSKYPTLKLFRFGELIKKEYRGQRSADALADFVNKQMESKLQTFTSKEDLESKIDVSKRNVIAYFAQTTGVDYKNMEKAASALRDDCVFW
uniref:Thioredoxin domain-containing protein n=1 Tax=Ditylenchus dipsaci TaxID=166011 RepID=A0A915EKE8_9BILA